MPGSGRAGRVTLHRCVLSVSLLLASAGLAQQTGSIEGRVERNGAGVADIAVVAAGAAMPSPRRATTDATGRFTLPDLVPGRYRISVAVAGQNRRAFDADVLLGQMTSLAVVVDNPVGDDVEELVVVAQRVSRRDGALVADAIDSDSVTALPVGRDYRDLVKLAPGVQYTQELVRGPSAGGNGQDNIYRFDGVDVSLPMFGTLSAEPSTHDIDQVTFVRGGVDAIGFNRSGGFTMDSMARTGTDQRKARVEFAAVPEGLVAARRPLGQSPSAHGLDQTWLTASAGGPLLPSQLFAYGSFYRPVARRANKATAYGPTKDHASRREEYYGKLTYAPRNSVLLNAAWRTSRREERGVSIGPHDADSVSLGGRTEQDIASIDGSWAPVVGPRLSFRYSEYALRGFELPDVLLTVQPSLQGSLDLERLDEMGQLRVPARIRGADGYNAAVGGLIDRYGYLDAAGSRAGGGAVGAHPQIGEQTFSRRGVDIAIDHKLDWGAASHALHVGIRRAEARERLLRTSNGWGTITVPGGVDLASDGTPIFYVATVQQMSLRQLDGSVVDPIVSSTRTASLEVNDVIRRDNLAFNVGVLVSEDALYGQGLRASPEAHSGFAVAPGRRYRMYTIAWRDMIQPRVAVRWNYRGDDEVFVGFARYHPAASSLARAASWDRNSRATLRVLFDEDGGVIAHDPLPGSSGKVFQSDLAPRQIDEWTVGTTYTLSSGVSARAHLRRREGSHFWEDTWNGSRGYDNAPAHIAAKGLYVPDLDRIRAEIGGSSYVIAELDDAYTEYWEASVAVEWRGEWGALHGSYVRSRYTGNFDQDNTSAVNDANRFIGSSNLADGYGRQLWDSKDGVLRGDRPHLVKVFGHLYLPWQATAGIFGVYQSGQPWEAWDALAYGLPSYHSSTIRYTEPAGSRRSPAHWQVDLSYRQRIDFLDGFTATWRADLFNVFDRQTGYNINPYARDPAFGLPRSRFNPRRLLVSIAVEI